MAEFVGAIDAGTTSTRFMVFDHAGTEIGRARREHRQILPRDGWVEHDPEEIYDRTVEVIAATLAGLGLRASDLVAVGVTNQRETTVVWDARTGRPLYNAIVWQDTRTDAIVAALGPERGEIIRRRTGLPPATYFSAAKIQWILDHVEGARRLAAAGHARFGTIDSWLLWRLTGGAHVTDVTNASRTMLMDLTTLAWDDELLSMFGLPRSLLPEIRPSADPDGFGRTRSDGPFDGSVAVTAALGDQHAATVGQVCFAPGEAKNTYGTGNFLVLNTGTEIVRSAHGLLTTVAYRLGDAPAVYALEGSVAVTGAAVQWLRDSLGIISSAADIEALAGEVPDAGGICFVPAFSGLFAPRWRPDARGVIVGLSRFHTRAHLARATLEAICYQSRDVAEAMAADAGRPLEVLKVDGGVTANDLCMRLQADILGIPVSRPAVTETTALGAAYAAGLAVGFWRDTDELRANWKEERRFTPTVGAPARDAGYARWTKAVERTLGWVD
jgi:glycerol kinase